MTTKKQAKKSPAKVTGYFYADSPDPLMAWEENVGHGDLDELINTLDNDDDGKYVYEVEFTRQWRIVKSELRLDEMPRE